MFVLVSAEIFLNGYFTNLTSDVRFPYNLYQSNIYDVLNSKVQEIKANNPVSMIILKEW